MAPTQTIKSILAAVVTVSALLGPWAGDASATVTCAKFASPTGSDTASGSLSAPFRTAQHLIDSLQAGQTGCLRAGNFSEDVTINKPSVALASNPGETATLTGRLNVTQNGDGVTVSNLHLDGHSANPALPSPTVNGDNITFSGNDVTNNQGICFQIGSGYGYGRAHNVVIEDNRIHHCGNFPPTNYDHGIYVEASDNLVIRDNVIDHNADRGIQLYPDADGTVITNNVIDHNGEGIIFSGEFVNGVYQRSDNNHVEHNLITNSQVRWNVESNYPGGGSSGTGNVVQDNCIHGANGWYGDGGTGIQSPLDGFTATNNLNVAPAYSNPAAGDYSLPAGSACADVLNGGDVTGGTDGSGATNNPAPSGGSSQPAASGSAPVTQTASRKCKPAKKCRRLRHAKPA